MLLAYSIAKVLNDAIYISVVILKGGIELKIAWGRKKGVVC